MQIIGEIYCIAMGDSRKADIRVRIGITMPDSMKEAVLMGLPVRVTWLCMLSKKEHERLHSIS